MDSEKLFQDFIKNLEVEKEESLRLLEEEYKRKRQTIEKKYDSLLESVCPPCELCVSKSSWCCSLCDYKLCFGCVDKIYKTRLELMKTRIPVLKLSPLPLSVAKKQFIKKGLKCPQCRTTKLTVK